MKCFFLQSGVLNMKLYPSWSTYHIFSTRKSTEDQQSKPARSDTFLEESCISSLRPRIWHQKQEMFFTLGRFTLMLQRVQGESGNKFEVPLGFIFPIFVWDLFKQLKGTQYRNEGNVYSTPVFILLQLQLYSHQFWPQEAYRTACTIFLLKLNEPRV